MRNTRLKLIYILKNLPHTIGGLPRVSSSTVEDPYNLKRISPDLNTLRTLSYCSLDPSRMAMSLLYQQSPSSKYVQLASRQHPSSNLSTKPAPPTCKLASKDPSLFNLTYPPGCLVHCTRMCPIPLSLGLI